MQDVSDANRRSVIVREKAIKDIKRNILQRKWGREVKGGAAGTRYANFEAGDIVMQQGDEGTEMYYVQRGELDVFVNKNKVHTLREGDFFGEFALLYGGKKRSATIVATTYCRLMALGLGALEVVKRGHLDDITRRTMISTRASMRVLASAGAEGGTRSWESDPSARAFGLYAKRYSPGQKIVVEGEVAKTMFYIEEGEVRITLPKSTATSDSIVLQPGQFFGENGLRNGELRNATASSIESCLLWVITRRSLEQILDYRPEFSTNFSYHSGAMVVKEGEPSKFMFYVLNGELDVLKGGQPVHRVRQCDFFGESGLRKGMQRSASVEAVTEVNLAVFSTEDLERIITYHSQYGIDPNAGGEQQREGAEHRHTMKASMNMDKEIRIKAKLQETLLRFKSSMGAGADDGVNSDGSGYQGEGDESMYTIESLMQRAALVDDPQVVSAIRRHWQLWDLDGDKSIQRDEYVELNMLMQKALVDDLDPTLARENAEADWARDVCNGEDLENMNYDQFRDSMFEVADIWVDEIDPSLYASFLDDLLAAVGWFDHSIDRWRIREMEQITCVADELRSKYAKHAAKGKGQRRKQSVDDGGEESDGSSSDDDGDEERRDGRRQSVDEFLPGRNRPGRRRSLVYYQPSDDDEDGDESEGETQGGNSADDQARWEEEGRIAAAFAQQALQPHSLAVRRTGRAVGTRIASISNEELSAALASLQPHSKDQQLEHVDDEEVDSRYAYIATTGGSNSGRFKIGEEFTNPAAVVRKMQRAHGHDGHGYGHPSLRCQTHKKKQQQRGSIHRGSPTARRRQQQRHRHQKPGQHHSSSRLPRLAHSAGKRTQAGSHSRVRCGRSTTAADMQPIRSVPQFNRQHDPQLNRLAAATSERLPLLFGGAVGAARSKHHGRG